MNEAFDGWRGRIVAQVMARWNRDMEQAALDELAPCASDALLVLGFGAGVGIRLARERCPEGWVGGADPSAVMLEEATRRNRADVRARRVRLARTGANALPFANACFDGALAVNSVQLWEPFEPSFVEVARVLRPGAHLVTLTHDWAIAKHAPPDVWLERAGRALAAAGFVEPRHWSGGARSGKTLGLAARRS
jgi:ubiquinone/menaquinone biosynthesis C-methylase UbiE